LCALQPSRACAACAAARQGLTCWASQVGALLHSFGINAGALPAEAPRDGSQWDGLWNQQRALPPDPAALHSHHDAMRLQQEQRGAAWATEFAAPQLQATHLGDAWSTEFQRRRAQPAAEQWAETFSGVRASDARPQVRIQSPHAQRLSTRH